MKFQEIKGTTEKVTSESKLSITSFSNSNIVSDFNKEFINSQNLFLAYETITTQKTTYMGDEVIDKSEHSTDNKPRILTQSMIDEYAITGKIPPASFHNNSNNNYFYIAEKDLKEIYKQDYFNLSDNEFKTSFNPLINDNEKYCCVKFIKAHNKNFIQTEDNRYFAETVKFNTYCTTSSFWNLEGLLENIIKNKQFVLFYEKGSTLKLVDVNNPAHLSKIITTTPHYNQNEDGNQEEFACHYILNNDEIKCALSHKDWVMKLYGNNETILDDIDRKKIFFSEEIQILSLIPNGLEHYREYQSLLETKYTKLIAQQKPVSKFRAS